MKIYDNGIYREMTDEELAQYEADCAETRANITPTTDDRISALEAAMLEMIIGGDTNV